MGPEDVDLTGGLLITYKGKDFSKGCVLCCAFVLAINSQHNSHMGGNSENTFIHTFSLENN